MKEKLGGCSEAIKAVFVSSMDEDNFYIHGVGHLLRLQRFGDNTWELTWDSDIPYFLVPEGKYQRLLPKRPLEEQLHIVYDIYLGYVRDMLRFYEERRPGKAKGPSVWDRL